MNALTKARAILSGITAGNSSVEARGRRAHARALATVESADHLAGIEKQLRIANLIASVQLGGSETVRARAEIKALLFQDESAGRGEQAA